MRRHAGSILSLVLALSTSSVAELVAKNYARIALHDMTILGDYLYIDGGELSTYIDGQTDDSQPSRTLNTTVAIPLNKSWTNATVQLLMNHTNHNFVPPLNTPVMWADSTNNLLYRWGGDGSYGNTSANDDVHLWSFTPEEDGAGKWGIQSPSNPSVFLDILAPASAGGTSCGGKGFSLGGFGSAGSDSRLKDNSFGSNLPLPGMITYDFDSQAWANDSSAPLTDPGTSIRTAPVCLDSMKGISSSGMVAIFGGSTSSAASATDNAVNLADMSNITVFDAKKNEWYSQKATGDIPPGRTWFGSAGAHAQDGTYNIYIYGGQNPADGTLSDIAILSLPGFHWFSTEIKSPERVLNKCVTYKNQMISLGGLRQAFDWAPKDEWPNSVGVLDMQKLEWQDSFNPDAEAYDSPGMIKDWYKAGNYGKLEWNDAGMKGIFADVSVSGAPAPTANGQSSSSGSSSKSSSTPVGAIAGGVVGGVAALAIIGVLIFFLRRRARNRRQPQTQETPAPSYATYSEAGGNMDPSTGNTPGPGPVGLKGYYAPVSTAPGTDGAELDGTEYRDPYEKQNHETQQQFVELGNNRPQNYHEMQG